MNIIKSYIVTNAAASSGSSGTSIQFQDEGVNLGNNTADTVDFVGAGVTATRVLDKVTVTILAGGGSGTVTSVGALSPLFTTANPTTTPTFTAVNQNANLVYAGPATGIAAAPTFRALVVADLPLSGANDWAFENPGNANFFSVGGADPFDSVSFIANTLVQSYAGAYGIKVEPTGITLDIPSSATGDIFTRNASGFLTRIPDVATGNALISGGVGVVPSYGKIGLTTHVSGILPVANGGTGASSLSGLPFWSLTGDSTLNPSVGTNISVFIDSTDDLRFLPTTGDQVAGMAFGLPGNTFAQFEISSQIIRIHTRSSGFESINLSETQSNFYASDGTTNSSLRLTGTTATITGTLAAFAGLQAAADYSANFTARSYIDKGYADLTYAPIFTVLGPANGGTGIANNAASTLTISGNFATTLTVTATTGVTLPTTGTLATLAGVEVMTNKTLSTGTVFSVIPTINDGITFTFNPSSTVAGISTGQLAGNPSSTVNGDLWYNTSTTSLNVGKNGTIHAITTNSAGSIGARVPFWTNTTNTLIDSANLTFVTNRLLGTTLYLTLSAGTATAGTGPLIFTSSGTGLTGLLGTPVSGVTEFTTYGMWITTTAGVRNKVFHGLVGAAAPATNTIGVVVDYYGTSATRVLTTPNTWISMVGDDGNTYKIAGYS